MRSTSKSKRERFAIFLESLKLASPADSRERALALMKETMDRVEDEFSGTDRTNYSERMHVWDWRFEWRDMESDPCYWDDSVARTHRTQIYHSGRIVITNLKIAPASVVLDKPGAN
jgi:hypothetical protein